MKLSTIIIAIAGLIILVLLPVQIRKNTDTDILEVFPQDGVVLPIRWGNIGYQMVQAGVIDMQKFEMLYKTRGGLSSEMRKLLTDGENGYLVMNEENAGVLLNMLWAFGLANKNPILEQGPMMDPRYGGAGRFASTGGWTLAQGNAMDHYSAHQFVTLTGEQQLLVERVSKNIYRPCCDNPTYFPDCNHGMAMLGLLELMAASGVPEEEMYRIALQVNELWFPNQYAVIAQYLKAKDPSENAVNAEEILGKEYSSASGYRRIVATIGPQEGGGASCGA